MPNSLPASDSSKSEYGKPHGRTGCVECRRSRKARARKRARQARRDEEIRAAREAEKARAEARAQVEMLNPAAVPPGGVRGGVASGEKAALYRLALRVRASRGLPPP